MLPATTSGEASKRAASDNQMVRNVFVIGPDKKIQLILVYPMTMDRNCDEVLRAIDSLQLTARHWLSGQAGRGSHRGAGQIKAARLGFADTLGRMLSKHLCLSGAVYGNHLTRDETSLVGA
jgi:hypothetical protein